MTLGGRIPASLQAIFMASNRGEEVYEAPKDAFKVFNTRNGEPNTRIPLSLQAVFVASNQGQEVHEPPSDRSAMRVYRRVWRRQRNEVSPWACLPRQYTQVSRRYLYSFPFFPIQPYLFALTFVFLLLIADESARFFGRRTRGPWIPSAFLRL